MNKKTLTYVEVLRYSDTTRYTDSDLIHIARAEHYASGGNEITFQQLQARVDSIPRGAIRLYFLQKQLTHARLTRSRVAI